MSNELIVTNGKSTALDSGVLESVLLGGDLSRLKPAERVAYMMRVCDSLGLNPLTKPFEFLQLNGKMTLYARKDCTEQLRKINGISVKIVSREVVEGVYVVTSQATDRNGRADESIGAVPIEGLKGEAKANALMKAETKSKRRVTLSISGLGMLDESELEGVHGATPVIVDEGRRGPKAITAMASASTTGIGVAAVVPPNGATVTTTEATATDPKEHPAIIQAKAIFGISSPSVYGAEQDSQSAAPSTETPANDSQPSETLPERIRTTDEELAELAEPDDGEEIDFVEQWEFHKEGSNKAHTATGEWIKRESPSQRRTLKQNARLNVLRNMLELTDEQWHAGLQRYYNKESSRDLSIEEATDMISKLETRYNQRKHKTPTAKLAAKWEKHNNGVVP